MRGVRGGGNPRYSFGILDLPRRHVTGGLPTYHAMQDTASRITAKRIALLAMMLIVNAA